MSSILIVAAKGEPFEYWCGSCHQLRLSCDSERTVCGNYGAPIQLKGFPGELDAEGLRSEGR